MGAETIARRYAIALADVVEKRNETEKVKAELEEWEKLFDESTELKEALLNPIFKHETKEKILETLIEKAKPLQTTANFLRVLLRNNRLGYLREINKIFSEVIEERQNIARADVVSAYPLSEDEKKDLVETLEKRTGKKIKLNLSVDPTLIGGLRATVGSVVYDGSIRNRLEILKTRLINNA